MSQLELLPVTLQTLANATLWFGGFLGALFIGGMILPGQKHKGQPLPDGTQETYKLSGLVLFAATHIGIAAGVYFLGWSLSPLLTHFWSLFLVVNVFAVAIVIHLLLAGWRKGQGELPKVRRSAGASTSLGNQAVAVAKDIWFGPELNPKLFGVDLKMFMYQPSLIGLAVLNAAFAFAQYEIYGAITPEMWLYQAFLWSYLLTHYVKERFMLSTWDIMAENFGFMLTWGDLVYVPFLYTLVGWWVVPRGWAENAAGEWIHTPFPVWAYALLVAFHIFCHWVFRGSNWQKDRFKRNPSAKIWGKPAETIGGRLLISGWWGVGRKINYSGELGVYFSFALCSGFTSIFPFLLPLSLMGLLVHRAGRDESRCRQKYGVLWEQYCKKARFRIFPLLY